MSSKKSKDTDSAQLSNIKIKTEPGTSSSTTPTPAPFLKNIKTEPGLPATTTRLTSFRVPRDLTLGGNIKTEKPKKIYAPNINVQRNKKKEDGGTVKKNDSKPGRGRGRGRGQGERGRGRGKTPSNLVQSTGVFSEGITEESRSGRRYSGYRSSSDDKRDAKTFMEKPLLKLNQNFDKEEEEERLKTLLRDDFIDDGIDAPIENGPIMLPLKDEEKLYKKEPQEEIVKTVTPVEEEVDVKPIILSNGEAVMPPKAIKVKLPNARMKHEAPEDTIPQIIENPTNGYMLIQFPDCLPGLRTNDELTDPRLSKRPNEQTPAASNVPQSEYCTLGSLKGGMLGKIQIHKSGKARLLIGENGMVIDIGSQLSFRQDLVAAKIDDSSNAELVNLGRVHNTLVCSPDWETMLSSL